MTSVGFASPPDWLKSYDCLSQGGKMRVDIARALCLDKPLIIFDEFTSVVDREITKSQRLCYQQGCTEVKEEVHSRNLPL